MKYCAIIVCLLTTLTLSALGTLRVKSIKELPATHTNLEVYDADGKFAPVLIVKSELKGLGFQNVSRPTLHAAEYMEGDHQYKFYMNDNQRVVKITHADYNPLEVRLLADFSINVKAQRVYEMVLTNVPEKEFIIVNIVSKPADASKIIDGKDMGTSQSFELFIGTHSLKLAKNGFKSITKDIEVSKSSTLFSNLILHEEEPIMITIKSTPNEADIYFNNVNEGKTNKQLFKFPGEYNLRLVADKYDTVKETITVTENGNNTFDYTLQKNTSLLTINTTPSNCEIYLNNEKLTGSSKEVSAGNHQIKIIKSGYDDIDTTVKVEKGIDKTENFILEKNTSILTINITPSNCEVNINNEKLTGSSKEVSAGMYRVEVKKEGYYEQSRTVNVEKGKSKTETFTLEQKTGKLQFVLEPMEAQVSLKQDSSTIQSWSGSKYLSSLPIGNYTITATCNNYKSSTKQIKINLDETTKVNIILEKGKDVILSGVEGQNMVFVQGGTFQMGSNEQDNEKPVHTETVSDFYIGNYEVTQKEWDDVMKPNLFDLIESGGIANIKFVDSNEIGEKDNLPKVNISWYDAVEFCNKKSEKEGLQKCYSGSGKNITCNFNANGYRLPTEAEWEYAARGGNKSRNYKYSGSNTIGDVACYTSNSNDQTHSVGTKQANELGIYDMSGNVWEWCWDWYDMGYYGTSPQRNPQGALSGSYRVFRGGSWVDNVDFCRVANRNFNSPVISNRTVGFRLLRSSK